MNDNQKTTYFGETNFRNQLKKFGIKKNDRRKHMYIIGKTGMGKTTLLENMAVQDIQNGEGMAFLDPHGDTAERLLDFVPKERINDVIYFNPADTAYPIGFNVMENVDPERRHLVSDGLMGVFKKIWEDVWSSRMEYILTNTILALLEYPEATLLGINQMLINKDFRRKVVEHVTDPVVKSFWTQEFAKYTDKYAAEATPAIQNKVGQFVSNPLIRNIIGQPKSAFDIRKAMDEKKIIIINLAKGRVGEDNSRLIGAMLVTKLYLAAMSRVDILEPERKDFFLYVDEFQNFASESFANILSEARKYRLSLILTHQYVAQMEEEVRDAVFGNVGTTVTFRVGAEDAEMLEKEFSPEFMVEDIVNLGFANIYLKLMIDGVASRPFSATTLQPIQQQTQSFKEEIIEASRKNYGGARGNVEEKVNKWMEEISGGDIGTATAKKWPARSEAPVSSRQQTSQPLYDAVCAVCGKKTQVPFPPDPARPVFCKEHIGMAGRFKQTFTGQPANQPRREEAPRPRPSAGEFVPRQEPARTHQPFKRTENIQMLREALKKSLDAQKNKPEPVPAPKNESGSGTLKPGERIEL
ncbi:MAG: type IV secretion system DNA-binding domain-containing protein [Candidatus Giovannonibacteria bacterium]|nr:type IV secretion system DNA-binding domain-containing protein [Candidatus Giovannonibacteria bacterium]